MLAPLNAAVKQAPDGVIVLLTDGEVGNEKEILEAVLAKRKGARVYSFGIGTNVSDALLRDLGKRTGGGIELIHPGERIDDKVIATFARAVAPRVAEVRVAWEGVEVDELAPGEPPALVDGEPWMISGRFRDARSGAAVITGTVDGAAFRLRVPVDFSEGGERPILTKLWASERIRDLEGREVGARREKRLRERIVELAVEHGVSSPYTAFLCVETRTGDRRTSGAPEARPIPVNTPAGWDMFKKKEVLTRNKISAGVAMSYGPLAGAPMQPPAPAMAAKTRGIGLGRAAGAVFGAAAGAAAGIKGLFSRNGSGDGEVDDVTESVLESEPMDNMPIGAGAPADAADVADVADARAAMKPRRERELEKRLFGSIFERQAGELLAEAEREILGQQLASGLWDLPEAGAANDEELRQLRSTTTALLALLRDGITTSHALHGAQIKKAVDALLPLAVAIAGRDGATAAVLRDVELALGTAWLISSGRRTRAEVKRAASGLTGLHALVAAFGDEPAVRQRVEAIAAAGA